MIEGGLHRVAPAPHPTLFLRTLRFHAHSQGAFVPCFGARPSGASLTGDGQTYPNGREYHFRLTYLLTYVSARENRNGDTRRVPLYRHNAAIEGAVTIGH